jgi:membrane protein YqaA with SNARE-associated domain
VLPPPDPVAKLRDPGALLRLLAAALVLIALVFAVSSLFRPQLEAAGNAVVAWGGLSGVALLVFLCDPIPGPGFQPVLVVGTSAGVPVVPLYLVAVAGSLASSSVGWLVGTRASRLAPLQRALDFTGTAALLARWGLRGVAIASLAPLPWVFVTLGAGAAGFPFPRFLLAASTRSVKILLSLVAIQVGWKLAA